MRTTLPVFLLALAACSCSGKPGEAPLYPVTGKVMFRGKPVEGARVFFHPDGPIDPKADRPQATVGADGSFTLGTHKPDDGAAAGTYKVTVSLRRKPPNAEEEVELMPTRYLNPATSGMTAEVTAGPTTLKPFELK
jgi:hypothetical protein